MTVLQTQLVEYADRDQASFAVAQAIATSLADALQARGQASLAVSGGTTPAAAYALLSEADLDWSAVTVGLVDERWVETSDPRSNENLLRQHLLQNKAAATRLLGMKTDARSPMGAIPEISQCYQALSELDVVVLGMGEDGHTASWFPNSIGLAAALDVSNPDPVCAIDATGSAVAGDYPQRLTLTASAIARAKRAFLLIFGDRKMDVLTASLDDGGSLVSLPINHAIGLLGDRLSIHWAR